MPASSSYYGSPDEYKAYWNHVQDRFAASGVTNAVWVVDWSANGGATPEYHPLLAALWPGDDRVDWLLWNVFTFSFSRGWSFDEFVSRGYDLFERLSGVPQMWEGVNYTANYTAKPWGLVPRENPNLYPLPRPARTRSFVSLSPS